ncbi:type II toxin-antitoxin system RelE/ParE family toxin [Nisaea acidiphila]|uniref:Type II toxin-antitoxin system RelE/ParE family toxin n=1 Tax=Nisaea acidiphila TaxID=1862145 RepID=A0A9J7AMD3_9PROT|nr:type II toxin-antitoxin system RelE/ParE family toxin [Nisaea acidiphila]UUX48803.1 type II toxin-antitoxin system RelE/ParE family toxin [Nisaea acidiphila]
MAGFSLSRRADEDVARLYRYGIETFGLTQADRYFDGLWDHFRRIAAAPELYQAVDHVRPGYRRSVYGAHAIYYRVVEGGVRVERVLGREDPSVLV